MIAIIDYGLGNPLSIKNMLKKVGAGQVVISNDIEVLQSAKCLILPGVGHFTQGMQNLQNQGLIEVLNDLVLIQKKPILGICLGMQLMTSYSEEGNCNGLGWIEANTKKFIEVSTGTSVTVTIRPTLTSLSIGQYHTLLRYCLDNKLLMKTLLVSDRSYLEVAVLPNAVKQSYIGPYKDIIEELSDISLANEINESDLNNYKISIKLAAVQALNVLNTCTEFNPTLFKLFVDHCKKWDSVYKLNALELYPELKELFIEYGY